MKTIKKIVAIILCSALLLCGCKKTEKSDEKVHIEKLYQKAVDDVAAAPVCSYKVTQTKSTTIGNQHFVETRQQTISMLDRNSDTPTATVDETITIGTDTVELSQTFCNDQGYIRLKEGHFTAPITKDDFYSQFAPIILLNQNRYKTVEQKDSNGITVILFSEPICAEDWALPSTAVLTDAHGNATIDSNGKLIAATYHIIYTDGAATVQEETAVAISHPSNIEIQTPDHSQYTKIDALLAPKILETAYLYLNNAKNIRTSAKSDITSEAFSLNRVHNTYGIISFSDDFTASINSTTAQSDYSSNNTPVEISQQIDFKNGSSTTTLNGNIDNGTNMSQTQMETFCRDLLLGNIPPAEHLTAANIRVLNGHTIILFSVSSNVSDMIHRQASEALYGNPDFITNISTSIEPTEAEFYLTINSQTGIPTACGFNFETSHSVDYSNYKLISKTDQTFHLDTTSSATVTDPVAPMFYSITDEIGNTLWILATTQYGDGRSDSLPKKIYAALTEAQVLVTEYHYDFSSDTYGKSRNTSVMQGAFIDSDHPANLYRYLIGAVYTQSGKQSAAVLESSIRQYFIQQNYRLNQRNSIRNSIYQFAVPSGMRIDVLYPEATPAKFAAALSSEAQEVLLQNTLNNIHMLEWDAYQLLDALYYGKDSEIISHLSFEGISDNPLIVDELMQRMYNDPAEEIALSLSNYLTEGKKAFAVIDVQYLIFNNNVIDRLEDLGYTVTRH